MGSRNLNDTPLGSELMRMLLIVAWLLLVMSPAINADDRSTSFLNLGIKQQHLYSIDGNTTLHEYEEMYRRNQKYVRSTLKSYSIHALDSMGFPKQTVKFMGAAFGLVTNGAKLDLNKSKTLAIEFKDVGNQDRLLYFGVNLDW